MKLIELLNILAVMVTCSPPAAAGLRSCNRLSIRFTPRMHAMTWGIEICGWRKHHSLMSKYIKLEPHQI